MQALIVWQFNIPKSQYESSFLDTPIFIGVSADIFQQFYLY